MRKLMRRDLRTTDETSGEDPIEDEENGAHVIRDSNQ